MKKIILIILIIFVGYLGYQFYENFQYKEVSQDISKTGYNISIKYPYRIYDIKKGDGNYSLGYSGGITLTNKNDEDIHISISYELENKGNDTPHVAGDTGGGMWPPQPEEIIHDFDPKKHHYLGVYLGKELYVTDPNDFGASVVQKLENGKITGMMPLLSKDQERVNYYDNFTITLEYNSNDTEKNHEKAYKEFLKILKTLKIEKISDTETPKTKTTK